MGGIIYKATNLVNGKVYIGQTTRTLKRRKGEHLSDARNGSTDPFHNAIRCHGEENFKWEVIDRADNDEELNQKEIYWISYYNSYIYAENSNGYNATRGGNNFWIGENNPMYGKRSPNAKSIIQLSLDGEFIKQYPSAREGAKAVNGHYGNIISCCRGKLTHVYNSIWIYEDDYNELTVKQRVSEYNKKRDKNTVVQLTINGEFVAEYPTAKDGAKAVNGSGTSITACCRCEPKYKTHKGFIWMYKSDYEDESIRQERINRAINHEGGRPIVQLTIDGQFIKEYQSIKIASKDFNNGESNIGACCRGKQETAYGYKWMYKEDYIKLKQEQ